MIYIGIGSNLGNRIRNIENSKYLLKINGIDITRTSRYYETLSWPDPSKPKFINIVIQSNTNFSPKKLLKIFKIIEQKLGRIRSLRNAPRTCDIDLISYRNKILSNNISIPHKSMIKRNFVLFPLFEIERKWAHPITKKNIKQLIYLLPNNDIRSIKQI